MKFLAPIGFALVLVWIMVDPDWLNGMRPESLQVPPAQLRILAGIMLAGLVLVIATHFRQYLQTASE